MAIVIGTAGHIDHGKTALVKALTGIDCDRLEEEKRRGITIELGFAALTLSNGEILGIVDVPGHEKFIKNMVAGASGIDAVILVIAADEGVMPQTREHLDICTLLGIKHGMVALTKIDSVDSEMLELAQDDVVSFLKGSAFENAPIFPVSSFTGQGIGELKEYLLQLSTSLNEGIRSNLFRLPVDRVFTIKGHGTVVTGTSIAGSATLGDELTIYPENKVKTRIRAVQTHGKSVEQAQAGKRTSLNLANCTLEDVSRGDVLAYPHTLFPTSKWLVKLTCLKSSPQPIQHRKEVHLHHETAELAARIYFFDRTVLMQGETALAEIRCGANTPLIGVFGDHCVIRSSSPLRTIAGGIVLMPLEYQYVRKHFNSELVSAILALEHADEEQLVLAQIELAQQFGRTFAELVVLTHLNTKTLEKILHNLSARSLALCYDKEQKAYVSSKTVSILCEKLLNNIRDFHKKEYLKQGIMKNVLLSSKSLLLSEKNALKLGQFLIDKLLKSNQIVTSGELFALPDFVVSLAKDEKALQSAILKALGETPYSPPNMKEILEALKVSGKEVQPLLKLLIEDKKITRLNEAIFYLTPVIEELEQKTYTWFDTHETLDPAGFKELSEGLSRKYIIAILEYFDAKKITLRVGDIRKLRVKG